MDLLITAVIGAIIGLTCANVKDRIAVIIGAIVLITVLVLMFVAPFIEDAICSWTCRGFVFLSIFLICAVFGENSVHTRFHRRKRID